MEKDQWRLHPDPVVLHVGDMPLAEIKKMIASLSEDDRIELFGYLADLIGFDEEDGLENIRWETTDLHLMSDLDN